MCIGGQVDHRDQKEVGINQQASNAAIHFDGYRQSRDHKEARNSKEGRFKRILEAIPWAKVQTVSCMDHKVLHKKQSAGELSDAEYTAGHNTEEHR